MTVGRARINHLADVGGSIGQTSVATPGQRRVMAVAVLATVSTVFPGFLTGALAVQVSAEFGVGEATYGWGLGGFFLAATCGSFALGRLVQRIGPRRQILAATVVVASAQLVVGFAARSFGLLVGAMAVCGLANAANQTAVNLALTRARIERLGLAVAVKQSGMPLASLLGGLMVPTFALTVGWRWAYLAGSVLAAGAAVSVAVVLRPSSPAPTSATSSSDSGSPTPMLVLAAVAGGLLAFAAGALNGWVVSSGVDAGLSEATAGWTLSGAAAVGIAVRLFFGFRLDRLRRDPFLVAGLILPFGVLGVALLAVRVSGLHIAATVLAFAGGWVWPVYTNFGIVRANTGSAGSATGITQTGVYVGVFSAPLVTGLLIERFGYGPMWAVVAVFMVVGTALTLSLADRL